MSPRINLGSFQPATITPELAGAANQIIVLGWNDNIWMTPMKLQKLVYIANGFHLAFWGEPLFKDPIEAWSYGPVIPNLYHKIKKYGADEITGLVSRSRYHNPDLPDDENAKSVLKDVYEIYRDDSAAELSRMTHAKGSPWRTVHKPAKRHIPIPTETIREYYRQIVEEAENA